LPEKVNFDPKCGLCCRASKNIGYLFQGFGAYWAKSGDNSKSLENSGFHTNVCQHDNFRTEHRIDVQFGVQMYRDIFWMSM
jgi:hypothetical protein